MSAGGEIFTESDSFRFAAKIRHFAGIQGFIAGIYGIIACIVKHITCIYRIIAGIVKHIACIYRIIAGIMEHIACIYGITASIGGITAVAIALRSGLLKTQKGPRPAEILRRQAVPALPLCWS